MQTNSLLFLAPNQTSLTEGALDQFTVQGAEFGVPDVLLVLKRLKAPLLLLLRNFPTISCRLIALVCSTAVSIGRMIR